MKYSEFENNYYCVDEIQQKIVLSSFLVVDRCERFFSFKFL